MKCGDDAAVGVVTRRGGPKWNSSYLGTPHRYKQQHTGCAAIADVSFGPVVSVTLFYIYLIFTDMNKQVFRHKVCQVSDIQLTVKTSLITA